jgi:amino acid transporter
VAGDYGGVVICDGLVWSELGAALPGSGGSYHFLKEIFGAYRWGRLIPFLFIWQFLISGALEMASGYIGCSGIWLMSSGTWPGGERDHPHANAADRCGRRLRRHATLVPGRHWLARHRAVLGRSSRC